MNVDARRHFCESTGSDDTVDAVKDTGYFEFNIIKIIYQRLVLIDSNQHSLVRTMYAVFCHATFLLKNLPSFICIKLLISNEL